jgi:hypothetical protein
MSFIPLIVLLVILLTGSIYYLWMCRAHVKRMFRIIFRGKKSSQELKEMSLAELEDLLCQNKALERFEKCAEIRDEMHKRVDYQREF